MRNPVKILPQSVLYTLWPTVCKPYCFIYNGENNSKRDLRAFYYLIGHNILVLVSAGRPADDSGRASRAILSEANSEKVPACSAGPCDPAEAEGVGPSKTGSGAPGQVCST